jgi:hypothetical protein
VAMMSCRGDEDVADIKGIVLNCGIQRTQSDRQP